jgi:hypothetical protein
MGHSARNRKKSKLLVSPVRKDSTVARTAVKPSVPLASQRPQVRDPQLDLTPRRPAPESLAGLNLSDSEWDSLFCLAVRHHFEQGAVWVPSVLRTMALLEGINDKTGRPCRIYVLPNRRIVMVETLS